MIQDLHGIRPQELEWYIFAVAYLMAGGYVMLRDEHRLKRRLGHVKRSGDPKARERLTRQIEEAGFRVQAAHDFPPYTQARLLELPPETTVRPGHTDPTTVGDELESNRFVRIWRGLDPEGSESCTALGEPATLILLGDDYDGGHKAWVRWPDGSDDIVPGSQVVRGE